MPFNSPHVICEQILWLVKNLKLNFQVKETPFSLSLNLKKRFVQEWNTDQFYHQFLKPCSASDVQTQPNFCQTFPKSDRQNLPEQPQATQNLHCEELVSQLELLKNSSDEVKSEKEDLEKDLVRLDKSHKKLVQDNRELQQKHDKICFDLKTSKGEKELLSKECNKLSVALESCKKDLKDNFNSFDQKINKYKIEIIKLNEFKEEKVAETRRLKKAAKKIRQKEQKEAILKQNRKNKKIIGNDDDEIETNSVSNVTVDNIFGDDTQNPLKTPLRRKKIKVIILKRSHEIARHVYCLVWD